MDEVQQFCFWDAKSFEDCIIIIVNESVALALLLISIREICRAAKYLEKKILMIYSLIIAWAITQTVENFYSIIIYFTYLQSENGEIKTNMTSFSKVYTILDSFPGFFILTMFLTICYLFGTNLLTVLPIQRFTKNQLRFIKFQKYFYVFRIVWVIGMELAVGFSQQKVNLLSLISVISIVADALIINLILIISILIFPDKLDQLKLTNEKQKIKFKLEYLMMVIISIIRQGIDIFFLIYYPLANQTVICMQNFEDHLRFSIGYLIIGNIILHFLPIALFLKIYHYSDDKVERSSTFLQSDGDDLLGE